MLIEVFYQSFIQKDVLKNPDIYEMNEHFPPQYLDSYLKVYVRRYSTNSIS